MRGMGEELTTERSGRETAGGSSTKVRLCNSFIGVWKGMFQFVVSVILYLVFF